MWPLIAVTLITTLVVATPVFILPMSIYKFREWLAYRHQLGVPATQKPPVFQAHMPHAHGWWYVEFPPLPGKDFTGGTTALTTFGWSHNHAACFEHEGAIARRLPDAPWWSWFRRPR